MGAQNGWQLLGTLPALTLYPVCQYATYDLSKAAAIPATPSTVLALSWASSYSGIFQAAWRWGIG